MKFVKKKVYPTLFSAFKNMGLVLERIQNNAFPNDV